MSRRNRLAFCVVIAAGCDRHHRRGTLGTLTDSVMGEMLSGTGNSQPQDNSNNTPAANVDLHTWDMQRAAQNGGAQQPDQQQPSDINSPPAVQVATIAPREVDQRCFVAYVHGRDDHDMSPNAVSDADRLAYWQSTRGQFAGDFVYASSRQRLGARACRVLVVGYDARIAFTDPSVSASVASQLVFFANNLNIPDGRLIVIAHSQGGLIIRWILNHPDDQDADFAIVTRKTRYAITLATPHIGSPGAQAALAMASSPCALALGPVVQATQAGGIGAIVPLSQSFMEGASAHSGTFGDLNRTRRIYAVGTYRWTDAAATFEDVALTTSWNCLGLSDLPGCTTTPGDGLVTLMSGLGRYERTGSGYGVSWNGTMSVEGPFTPWLSVGLNHFHIRHNDEVAAIHNLITNADENMGIGDYIAAYGLALE